MNKSIGKHMKVKGKHMKETDLRPKFIGSTIIVLAIGVITGTSAYVMIKNSVANEFVIGEVIPEIIEEFDAKNKTKEDVYIKNSGNVPIYIRTAIVITWKDKDGKVLDIVPEENIDYLMNFSTSPNWMKSNDGYYYYKNPLEINAQTDILIEECIQLKEYEDRILEVSIATQGIQAEPSKAVIEAWKVEVIDNSISLGE